MIIINQDRDESVIFEKEKIHIFMEIQDDKLRGFSLMSDDDFLGTFDTLEEVEDEMQALFDYDKEYFVVSGYSDY
jgi:hypothetical protein